MVSLEDRDGVVPLSGEILLIEGPNRSRFPFSNGFLLTGGVTVLIDAGIGEERIREIDARRRIDVLILSHTHPDHLLAWHVLKDRRILTPRQTPASVSDLLRLGERFTGAPDKGAYWAEVVAKGLGLAALREPDGRFKDRQRIKAGDVHLEAVHCPGHLEDHYGFFHRESGTLLTTDIDFSAFGPWYGNPEGDIERFQESVRRLAGYPYVRVCSSHGRPMEAGEAHSAFEAYLAAFERQRRTVLSLCAPPRSLREMVALSPFYRNRMPDKVLQRIFEEPMIRKNLELLVRDGLAEEKYGQYRRTQ